MSAENAPRDQNFVPAALFQIDGAARGQLMAGQIDESTGRILVDNAANGDVVGPSSSTDMAIARWDGTTGKLLQNSVVLVADTTGNISGGQQVTVGVASNATGKLNLVGTTSGTVSVSVADAAGTWTMKLPTSGGTNGYFLKTDGSGNTSWDAASASLVVGTTTVSSGTDTKVLFDNAGVLGEYTISGSGNVAMTTSPIFTTPSLGAATATSITSSGSDLTIQAATGHALYLKADASDFVYIQSNGNNFIGFDGSALSTSRAYALPDTSGTIALTSQLGNLTVGTSTITSGTTTKVLYDNSGILGEYTISGSGNVAMTTSPSFTTPTLGAATATSINGLTITSSTGTLTISNGKTLSASNSITFAGTDSTTMTFPSTTQTIAGITATQTLTNKRITRRLTTTNAPGATPTTNTDNVDVMNFTGLSTAITSMTTNLSGTPVDGDLLEFRFTDDGTARAITWGSSFQSTTVTLPTTTVISTMLRVGFEWNATASKWDCIAKA